MYVYLIEITHEYDDNTMGQSTILGVYSTPERAKNALMQYVSNQQEWKFIANEDLPGNGFYEYLYQDQDGYIYCHIFEEIVQ